MADEAVVRELLAAIPVGCTWVVPVRGPGGELRDFRIAATSDRTRDIFGRGTQRIDMLLGELHPSLVRELELSAVPVLFELDWQTALVVRTSRYDEISRFPQVRRDIAVVVDEFVSLSTLRERVTLRASSLLREFRIFDVYRGSGVETGRKSIALGLIFQDISRTLTDEDVDRAVASIIEDLRGALDARIRE